MGSANVRAGKLLFLKNYITEEDLSSQIVAGGETEITFLNDYVPGTVRAFINGIRDRHFTETDTDKIEFSDAFVLGDEVIVDYVKK